LVGGKRIAVAAEGGSGGGADPMAFVHGPQRAALQDFVQALREGHEPAVSGPLGTGRAARDRRHRGAGAQRPGRRAELNPRERGHRP
jgi:hypothetical protein